MVVSAVAANERAIIGEAGEPPGLRRARTWMIILIILALMAVKLIVAAYTPIAFDEALYWRYSKHVAPGFMDHPFMNPMMIKIGTALFGDTPLGVRFMGLILSLPASWAVWRATSALFQNAAMAATSAFYFNLMLVMSIGSMVATSDQVVVTTTCFLLMFLAEVQRSGRGPWWLAVGAAFGLGLCSKYTTVFFAVSILAWLSIVPAQRWWFLSPWTWAGALVALAVFSPVLAWNAQHQWASFVYQSGRLTVYKWTGRYLLEFGGALVILATPPIFVLGCIGLQPPLRSRQDFSSRVLVSAMIAPLVLYLLWHNTRARSRKLARAGLSGFRDRRRIRGPQEIGSRTGGAVRNPLVTPAGCALWPRSGSHLLSRGHHWLPRPWTPRSACARARSRLEGPRRPD